MGTDWYYSLNVKGFDILRCGRQAHDASVAAITRLPGGLGPKRADDGWKARKESILGWQESTVAESHLPGGSTTSGAVRSSCSSGSCFLSGR